MDATTLKTWFTENRPAVALWAVLMGVANITAYGMLLLHHFFPGDPSPRLIATGLGMGTGLFLIGARMNVSMQDLAAWEAAREAKRKK